MPEAIRYNGAQVDLGPRLFFSSAVAASPALAAETIICTLTINADVALQKGVKIEAFAAYLVGASGTTVTFRIRRTDVSGTIVKATGALNVTAADVRSNSLVAVDTGITPLNQVYVFTMQVANGAAESTVSAATLAALVV